MADYNVNMKQWNGTSFDNVLPLAYNAKQLEGQSLAEVKQWVQDNGVMLYTGQYTGTGTYGKKHPMTLQFPFEPVILFMPVDPQNNSPSVPFPTNALTESYKFFYLYSRINVGIKVSSNRKSILFYGDDEYNQFNLSGKVYYFAANGGYDIGGQTEWTITSSGTWTVPRTGRYYIELYGGGGGGNGTSSNGRTGGSSCQSYDSITLTKDQNLPVSIGVGGASEGGTGTATTFGNYSVNGGGGATSSAGGAGAGNLGKNGSQYYSSQVSPNYSDGTFGTQYGFGSKGNNQAGPGAVYLKYLGT